MLFYFIISDRLEVHYSFINFPPFQFFNETPLFPLPSGENISLPYILLNKKLFRLLNVHLKLFRLTKMTIELTLSVQMLLNLNPVYNSFHIINSFANMNPVFNSFHEAAFDLLFILNSFLIIPLTLSM